MVGAALAILAGATDHHARENPVIAANPVPPLLGLNLVLVREDSIHSRGEAAALIGGGPGLSVPEAIAIRK